MPYLLLILGILLSVYGLARFFMRANVKQIKAALFAIFTIVLAAALFYMAVSGRLPAAIAAIGALAPIALGIIKQKARGQGTSGAQSPPPATSKMSKKEALEVLNLEEGASIADIKNAYKNLMKKVHPDAQGSEWMAGKLNDAKDVLLKDEK